MSVKLRNSYIARKNYLHSKFRNMKKIIIVFALVCTALTFGQNNNAFGVRANLSYGSSGDLSTDVSNAKENPDSNIGYQFGFFAKFDLGPLYLRPELLYSRLFSDYRDTRFDLEQINAPILLGVNVIGPLNVFAGPSLNYTLDTELDENERAGVRFDFEDIEDRFTVGLQLGASVYFNNLEVGLRYDRALSDNVAAFAVENDIAESTRFVNTRTEQIILSLSLQL